MDDGSRMLLGFFIGIAFLLVKGFFTACESAVIEINDTRLKRLAENDEKAKRLLNLTSQPNKLLVSLSVFRALTTVIISIIAAVTFYYPIFDGLATFMGEGKLCSVISITIIVILTTLMLVAFGDSIPKKMVAKNNDSFAVSVSPILSGLMVLLSPFTKLVSAVTFIFGKLLGVSTDADRDIVTEEEILMMVDAVNETGVIEESQKEMINNIFEFGDLTISDVMTHRTDLYALERSSSIMDIVELAISDGFSRIPVYENSIDNIIGIIYIKDLLCLIGSKDISEQKIDKFIRDVLYVPETNRCGELFKKFTSVKAQLAVAIDEYGGTAGVVTMEDLLEAIVGNIQDEYDDEIDDIIEISQGIYEINGTADPELVLDELGLMLPEDHTYDTIAGFFFDILGYIPAENEHPSVEYKNVKFDVITTDDKRIIKLQATVLNQTVNEIQD